MSALINSDTWKQLVLHKNKLDKTDMKTMFAADPERFPRFTVKQKGILFDYSKNIINDETMRILFKLAEDCDLKEKIDSMFSGQKINITENRAVMHTALRNGKDTSIIVDSKDILFDINDVLSRMGRFAESVHKGHHQGFSGKKINTIVNIGIGGSDLGPAMICEALKYYAKPDMRIRFVSNVDGTDIVEKLKSIDPETTLFVIASKTFTTQETLTNAETAKKWFLGSGAGKNDIKNHFIALSTNIDGAREFGIDPKNVFGFWDWVGGRYSLWSAVGMSIALYIGFDNFAALLAGASETDEHFRTEPFERNIPVIAALLGVWYSNFFDARTQAVIPYDQYLARLPEYLQQLEMESNGKSVTLDGESVDYSTGPVIWGQAGTNAQHSFFQLIHQGTQMIPVDFIAVMSNANKPGNHHDILLSNFFAQTEALMKGRNEAEARTELESQGMGEAEIKKLLPHKIFPGNKPTNSILLDKLDPHTLGMLVAMYEHKVFVQGAIWNINSFDQWGVELGKMLAKQILPQLTANKDVTDHDSSTKGLINYYKGKH